MLYTSNRIGVRIPLSAHPGDETSPTSALADDNLIDGQRSLQGRLTGVKRSEVRILSARLAIIARTHTAPDLGSGSNPRRSLIHPDSKRFAIQEPALKCPIQNESFTCSKPTPGAYLRPSGSQIAPSSISHGVYNIDTRETDTRHRHLILVSAFGRAGLMRPSADPRELTSRV